MRPIGPRKLLLGAIAAGLTGCLAPNGTPQPSVDQVIRQRQSGVGPRPGAETSAARSQADGAAPRPPGGSENRHDTLATVDGAPISRAAVTDLLMRAHGPGILDQLVGLEAARRAAESKGIEIDQADLNREYDTALVRLVDPLASVNAAEFDRPAAEKLLDAVLAERNVSREEFLIVLRGNAYLRKLVQSEQTFSEAELREEYERAFGKRVQVRHIQLGSRSDVARVTERLAAGEDFGELAARYSANSASAKRGGLLDPFCENEPDLPPAFRQAAFALRLGEVSAPVRVGSWEHLIKLEKVLDPDPVDFQAVGDELMERRRRRVTDVQMRKLADELFQAADVRISDPRLREAFIARHPDRANSGGP